MRLEMDWYDVEYPLIRWLDIAYKRGVMGQKGEFLNRQVLIEGLKKGASELEKRKNLMESVTTRNGFPRVGIESINAPVQSFAEYLKDFESDLEDEPVATILVDRKRTRDQLEAEPCEAASGAGSELPKERKLLKKKVE